MSRLPRQRGWSLQDVGKRRRIRNLAGIEGERFEGRPAEFYVVGFVRQYARALGIPEFERLAKRYVERYRAARLVH